MSENFVLNNNESVLIKSKKCGVVGIVFSSIALGLLLYIWGLVLYAEITNDIGAAIGAAIYFAIGVFAQLVPMLIGLICGLVQKKRGSGKFTTISFWYTIVVAILSVASVVVALAC